MARLDRGFRWLMLALVAVSSMSACSKTSEGSPTVGPTSVAMATATETATETSTSTPPSSEPPQPEPPPAMGVVPTLREPVPPNTLSCLPPSGPGTATPVQIGDPAAPRIVVSLPAGWNAAATPTGASLTGPDGMSGKVAITETALDAGAAFEEYADDITASAPISSVSVLPAEVCGYSGQRLMGVVSGGAQGKQSYEDRIAHVWTNANSYLVVIHGAASNGTPAFDAATPVLTGDFAITIP